MDDLPVGRDRDGLGLLDDAADVVAGDLPVLARDGDDAAAVEALDVGARDADEGRVDGDPGHELGLLLGLLDRRRGDVEVDHDALAQALGIGRADPDDLDLALLGDLADRDGDLLRPDVDADDVSVLGHQRVSFAVAVSPAGRSAAAAVFTKIRSRNRRSRDSIAPNSRSQRPRRSRNQPDLGGESGSAQLEPGRVRAELEDDALRSPSGRGTRRRPGPRPRAPGGSSSRGRSCSSASRRNPSASSNRGRTVSAPASAGPISTPSASMRTGGVLGQDRRPGRGLRSRLRRRPGGSCGPGLPGSRDWDSKRLRTAAASRTKMLPQGISAAIRSAAARTAGSVERTRTSRTSRLLQVMPKMRTSARTKNTAPAAAERTRNCLSLAGMRRADLRTPRSPSGRRNRMAGRERAGGPAHRLRLQPLDEVGDDLVDVARAEDDDRVAGPDERS